MAEVEKRSFVDTFLDFDDACLYLDRHLREHAQDWDIEDAGVGFVNHAWRVGAIFTRKNEPLMTTIESGLKDLSEGTLSDKD